MRIEDFKELLKEKDLKLKFDEDLKKKKIGLILEAKQRFFML
mgnify:CR=1 FL=1